MRVLDNKIVRFFAPLDFQMFGFQKTSVFNEMTLNEAKTKRNFKIHAFGCVSMEVERQRSKFE